MKLPLKRPQWSVWLVLSEKKNAAYKTFIFRQIRQESAKKVTNFMTFLQVSLSNSLLTWILDHCNNCLSTKLSRAALSKLELTLDNMGNKVYTYKNKSVIFRRHELRKIYFKAPAEDRVGQMPTTLVTIWKDLSFLQQEKKKSHGNVNRKCENSNINHEKAKLSEN